MDLYSIKLYANIVTYYQRKAILIYHNKICKIPSDFVIIFNTNSRPTYRQILGYNNPILRQTPLTGGSLSAVVFLDWSYSIYRLYP